MYIDHKTLVTHDRHQHAIVLKWSPIKGNTDALTQKIHELTPLFVNTYVKQEMEFARHHPEAIATDFMLKSLTLFAKDLQKIDWQVFGQQLQKHMHNFFMTMDWKTKSSTDDTYFFVVAHDTKDDAPLGALQFFISPTFEPASIKAALFGMNNDAYDRGIEQLLMSSIFKIRPDITRIFLHTRSTNQEAIDRYLSWGFVVTPNKIPHWTDMEYCIEKSNTLQNK